MSLNFKRFLAITLIFFSFSSIISAQNDEEKQEKVYVQLKPGFAVPLALGDNFLAQAYELKAGFLGEARVFFPNRIFLGIHGNFFKAEVIDATAVGDFERTNIWHNYVTGGYALLPRESDFGLEAGLGIGYTVFFNHGPDIRFHDDGFSAMANLYANYRFSRVVGANLGVQFSKDFLATQTAPELEKFFKNASILYFSTGLVFYINQ
ncbi:MAG: hypothetical protein WBG48_00260 [Pricia sp.]